MNRIFIVDDDVLTCELLTTVSEEFSRDVVVFDSGEDFLLQSFQENDLVILDLMMPGFDGIEVIRALKKIRCKPNLILMSGYDKGVLHSAERLANEYGLVVKGGFTKPISIAALRKLLASCCSAKPVNENIIYKHVSAQSHTQFTPTLDDLLEAMREHQFILYFQPQISFKSKKIVGVEALVRWNHPVHGLVFPDQFIPLAESKNIMGPLTEEILDLSIYHGQQWKSQGHNIRISVNLSAQNITSLILPEQLTTLVSKQKIEPSMFVLEVTESALMGNLATALDILTRLRMKGFQLSIDDFGTGFSSLSQLHKIPFTELKIDQSFVNKMLFDTDCQAIVETCIMLGHKLEMQVVAEGIESVEINDLLLDMGCDIAQGYYFSKPMPAEKMIAWKNEYEQG